MALEPYKLWKTLFVSVYDFFSCVQWPLDRYKEQFLKKVLIFKATSATLLEEDKDDMGCDWRY
jgi:hypothetical protein